MEFLLLSVVVIWGTNLSVIKLLYVYFSPLAFNAVRLTLALVTMLAILKIKGIRLHVERRDLPSLIGLGIVSNTVYQILFSIGLERTRAGNVGLLMALVPIFACIAGVALKREHFNRRVLLGIALSVLGAMAIVVFGSSAVSFAGTWKGDLLVVGASFCWGWYTGSATSLIERYGALEFTALALLFGVAFLLPLTAPWLLVQQWSAVPPIAWFGLATSAWLAIVYNFFIWSYALKTIGIARTAVATNLTPVIALLAGWMLLGERPLFAQGVSIVLILAGLYFVRSQQSRMAEVIDELR